MILTIGNIKGGVGKTTTALNVAIARKLQGHDVLFADGDTQGTAQTAISIRMENNVEPGIACSCFPNGSSLRSQIRQQAHKYDDVIIDAGGRDNSSLRAALLISDVILIPFQPRSLDVWSLSQIDHLVEEAKTVNENLKAYAFLNLADPGKTSHDNKEAAEVVSDVESIKYLPSPLVRRKAFANAAGRGLSVLEYRPKDQKAINELNALIRNVFKTSNNL